MHANHQLALWLYQTISVWIDQCYGAAYGLGVSLLTAQLQIQLKNHKERAPREYLTTATDTHERGTELHVIKGILGQ